MKRKKKIDMKVLLKAQQGELNAVLMYSALSKKVKNERDAQTFKQLSSEEGRHASVFKNLTNQVLTPKKFTSILVPCLYRILGRKILYPLIAKGEYNAEKNYTPTVEKYPEVASVQSDEHRHGDMVMALLKK